MIIRHLKTLIAPCMALCLFMFTACTEDKTNNNAPGTPANLKFHLTDAPAVYDAVLIEILEVQVHIGDENDPSDSTAGWVVIDDIQPGIYDLLELQNGLDTVLAAGEVPPGKLSQIRLMLGDDNTVVVDGVSHDLKTPSAQQSGLKLQVNYELEPGLYYEFWLDFDASRSIVEKGNGGYNLKPVIRVFTKEATGSIEGYIDPAIAQPRVRAFDANDTASTIADTVSGYFLLSGLRPSTYSVNMDTDVSYKDTTITGVVVTQGNVTDLDTIQL